MSGFFIPNASANQGKEKNMMRKEMGDAITRVYIYHIAELYGLEDKVNLTSDRM